MFNRLRMYRPEGRRFDPRGEQQGQVGSRCGPQTGAPGPWGRGREEFREHRGSRRDERNCERGSHAGAERFTGFEEREFPDFGRRGREGWPAESGRGFSGRGERGFGPGGHGGRGFGFGGGRSGRLFDGGDLKLVILKLIADKPSYGYELIKAMEERLAGGYAPSPGVVYPTLTLLEEEGLATVATSDAGKKVYTVTDAGRAELTAKERRLAEIFERVEHAGRGFRRGRSPEIMRAFMNLRNAVQARVAREGLTGEQIAKMAEAIDAAAQAIDGM